MNSFQFLNFITLYDERSEFSVREKATPKYLGHTVYISVCIKRIYKTRFNPISLIKKKFMKKSPTKFNIHISYEIY